jgi:hypothetical protein
VIENVPLRRERDLSAVIGDSFTILFAHFGALAAIVLPAVVASLAFSLVTVAIEDDTAATLVLFASVVVQVIVFEFVRSAGVVYLDGFDRRDVIPSAESLDRAQQRFGVIAGAVIRSELIILALAMTIVGIPWAIMRVVRWAFISQVIMLEQKAGEEVLATSAQLVSGYWWATAGRLLVSGIIVLVPAFFVSGLAVVALPAILSAFVDAAIVFVTVPYGIISTTLMYFDLKARKARHDSINTA